MIYSSSATAIRSRFYLQTPASWPGLEVPYGSSAELPWVHAYAADDLYAGRLTLWAIFRIKWAIEEAVVLFETLLNRRVLSRVALRFCGRIRSMGRPTSESAPLPLTRRRPPSSWRSWTSRTSSPTRRSSASVAAPAAPIVSTARVGSGPYSRWMTAGRVQWSPWIAAPWT